MVAVHGFGTSEGVIHPGCTVCTGICLYGDSYASIHPARSPTESMSGCDEAKRRRWTRDAANRFRSLLGTCFPDPRFQVPRGRWPADRRLIKVAPGRDLLWSAPAISSARFPLLCDELRPCAASRCQCRTCATLFLVYRRWRCRCESKCVPGSPRTGFRWVRSSV